MEDRQRKEHLDGSQVNDELKTSAREQNAAYRHIQLSKHRPNRVRELFIEAVKEADRLSVEPVFVLASGTISRETQCVEDLPCHDEGQNRRCL